MYCSHDQSPISQYFRDRQERQEGLRNHRMRELERRRRAMIFPVPSALVEEPRMDRHTLVVLTSIIHEKVVSSKKSSDNDDDYKITLLPHETILSERSTTITNCYEIQLLVEKENNHEVEDDREEDLEVQQSILQQKKHNIVVEFLCSIRAMNDNCNQSSVDSNVDDLYYSPKVCPICCEEYEKDDDIAWSKNEECVHAIRTDCIVPWLMEHSDCPMCRNDYLCLKK